MDSTWSSKMVLLLSTIFLSSRSLLNKILGGIDSPHPQHLHLCTGQEAPTLAQVKRPKPQSRELGGQERWGPPASS